MGPEHAAIYVTFKEAGVEGLTRKSLVGTPHNKIKNLNICH